MNQLIATVALSFGLLGLLNLSACSTSSPSLPGEQPAHDAGSGGQGGSAAGAGGAAAMDPHLQLGAQGTLLPDGNSLGLSYFPDEGTSMLTADPFRIVITDGLSKSSYVLEASSPTAPLMNLSQATRVLGPGTMTDFDNGYAGISAVYRHSDGVFYGFYHAEDQVDTGTLAGTDIPGFYARIGIAYSSDGFAWTKGGYVIESFVPKRTPDGVTVQYDQGAAEPGAIASADNKYLYLYYTEHSRLTPAGESRPLVICMARADLSAWPPAFSTTSGPLHDVFKKYNGGSFSTDGIGGGDSPIVSPPTATSNALEGHVTYSRSLGKFVMIYGVDAYEERSASPPTAVVSGLYDAFSDDGITWRSSATPIITDFGVPQPGLSISWQGSILWDAGSDTHGQLVYAYSPDWSDPPHFMVSRALSLTTP